MDIKPVLSKNALKYLTEDELHKETLKPESKRNSVSFIKPIRFKNESDTLKFANKRINT